MKAQKQCSRCRATKPVTDFWRDRHASDGFKSACKDCLSGSTVIPYDHFIGDIHKGCGGELIPYDGPPDGFLVMRCSTCREAGIPV